MKTIGFTKKYYTLWEVGEPYKEYISTYDYYIKQDFTYIQNLSIDLEKAKAKLQDERYDIDLDLRGTSSFIQSSEKINEAPENIFAFGKYCGEDIIGVNDLDYTKWYYSKTKNEVAKKFLLDNGYKLYKNEYIYTNEEYEAIIQEDERLVYKESLKSGHHFKNGDRVDLKLKRIESFSFDGYYGATFVVTYASDNGLLFKYMGGSPPNIPTDSFINIKATIKHDNYNNINETKLQRVKT